ncbi:unnamed protein product [Menidia menidia]|uniref:(Atlantic silverside) hypothetical protein n=1 Tax=Menidia menidia TaxID=238744 RepID=A0A8S4AWY7_9TELE|nr:unnamed protein product [Menidia menidia]
MFLRDAFRGSHLDGQHDVRVALQHLHRTAVTYVLEAHAVGRQDLIPHLDSVLLGQAARIQPETRKSHSGVDLRLARARKALPELASEGVRPLSSTTIRLCIRSTLRGGQDRIPGTFPTLLTTILSLLLPVKTFTALLIVMLSRLTPFTSTNSERVSSSPSTGELMRMTRPMGEEDRIPRRRCSFLRRRLRAAACGPWPPGAFSLRGPSEE